MPDADDQKSGHGREVRIAGNADQRHIDLCLAPAGKRHVPSFPEIADVRGQNRPVEVLHDPEAIKATGTNGDVRVGAKFQVGVEKPQEQESPCGLVFWAKRLPTRCSVQLRARQGF